MEIPPSCGADALEMMLGELAAEKSVSTLLGISSGALKPVPQIHEEAVVCRKITREDGAVDWQKSAGEIEAMSRAYEGWRICLYRLGGAADRHFRHGRWQGAGRNFRRKCEER